MLKQLKSSEVVIKRSVKLKAYTHGFSALHSAAAVGSLAREVVKIQHSKVKRSSE